MRAILIALALAAAAFPVQAAEMGVDYAWKAIGHARVIDGDTLELISPRFYVCPEPDPCPEEFSRSGNIEIRLHGIDALEMDQVCLDERDAPWPCGEAAYYHLIRLIGGDDVTCFGGGSGMDEANQHGRRLAKCHVWPRVNLNSRMVGDGYALAYRRYSDDFLYAESAARGVSAGMWSGAFVEPWEWRQQKSAPTLESLQARLSACSNRSSGTGFDRSAGLT
jgi:endonuclease YncB( thermonuclease family)